MPPPPQSTGVNRELAKAFLEISEADWEALVDRGIARGLVNFIPFVIEYQDNLEDAKKFFTEMKELEVVPQIDNQLDALDKVRLGITVVVEDQSLTPKEIKQLLAEAHDDLAKAFTEYAKLEAETVEVIRTKSRRKPKQANIIEKVRSYWNHIDQFWPNEREAVLGKWRDYFESTNTLLRKAVSSLQLPNSSPSGTLLRVESLLKKRSAHFLAQKVSDARENIKNYYVEELGLIPGFMGAAGNWKVERDDCPEPRLPEFHTTLSNRFAFCRKGNKQCPSFDWSQGSYVRCKSFVRLKEAGLITGITQVDDKDYVKNLKKIAETDPYVQMLFISAKRGDGSLFWGRLVDDRLEIMLAQYPKSDRRGNDASYRVYLVANEPVFVSGGYAVAADRVLLETIGEGVRMPKTARMTRVAGPMIRLTFTANALRDPEFRDYLRKKNAVKSLHWTWDIPFDKEDDISFILSEIKEEFGYPIIVMEILDDSEAVLEKNFGIRDFSKLPIVRHSSVAPALMYIPRVEPGDLRQNTCNMQVAEKLVDVANNLSEGKLKTRVAYLADTMRVGRHFIVATYEDLVVYGDNAIGLVPEPGMQLRVKDPDSGSMVQTEVTEVVRDTPGHPKEGIRYKVRKLDDGKEIELKRPWIRPFDKDAAVRLETCGCGGPPMPPDETLPEKPPLGYFPGGDGSFFIFRLPEEAPHPLLGPAGPPPGPPPLPMPEPGGCGGPPPPPPPYGRFPGDEPPPPPLPLLPPPLKIQPRSPFAPQEEEVPFPFPPAGGPFSDAPAPPPPHGPRPPIVLTGPPAQEEHGPVQQDTQVFTPAPPPKPTNPDEPSEGEALDEAEQKILDEIKKRVKPGLKFKNLPRDPTAPSGAQEEEVDDAIRKLRKQLSGNPSVKDIRRDLTPTGKPVLFVHTTMPKHLKEKVPTSVNGFEVRVSPLHDSLADGEDADREAADVLVAPSPDRPEQGKSKGREREPGPYLNQTSGPPPQGEELHRQTRDIPKMQ